MNSFLFEKKIAVLCGGPSSEREVSLRSGAAVARALRLLGADAFEIDVQDGNFHLPTGTELAFNALHGTFGEDGCIQAILDRHWKKLFTKQTWKSITKPKRMRARMGWVPPAPRWYCRTAPPFQLTSETAGYT